MILTNELATITQIECPHPGITMLQLEWSNVPSDRRIDNFDLRPLGDVGATGGTDRTGWVALHGDCQFKVGDTLTLKD